MKEKILYLECYSGISGDMTVAALLDLGADQKALLDGLNSLKVGGYRIEIGRRAKNSIDACDFNVILKQEEEETCHSHENTHKNAANHSRHTTDHPHVHSHEHFHKHGQEHVHLHLHEHSHDDFHQNSYENNREDTHSHMHDHSHEHNHDHSHDHIISHMPLSLQPQLVLGHHEHRNLSEINEIIEQSDITDKAKMIAKKIFRIIAVAEAKAHAKPIDEVHFHEVGAVDSIVDIVATAICLDNLDITRVIVSELYEGTGQIRCQHGLIPIPVPAVTNISAEYQLPLHITNVKGELVTPTGAAIAAAIRTEDELPKEMKIFKLGLGAGKRNYEGATGLLRAMLIEDATVAAGRSQLTDKVWILEANIDDCTGEALALAMEMLFQNGAKDVYYTPIFMKKNRPAYLLGVICSEEDVALLEGIIFMNTTTIGIRKHEAVRTILPRETRTISTPYGDAQVKVCMYQGQTFFYPEYESVRRLCQASGQNYMSMYQYIRTLVQGT
jgi:uncharacterized protein (TIGR00299 family) protein